MSESLGYTPEEMAGAVEDAEAEADAKSKRRDDFIETFGTAAGQRVFEYFYVWCRQNQSTYSTGQDVTHTAFLEGRRSVVLEMMKYLTLDDVTIIERARNRALRTR